MPLQITTLTLEYFLIGGVGVTFSNFGNNKTS